MEPNTPVPQAPEPSQNPLPNQAPNQVPVTAPAPTPTPTPDPIAQVPVTNQQSSSTPPNPVANTFDGPITLLKSSWNLFTNHWKVLAPILLLPTIVIDVATLIMYNKSFVGTILGVIIIIVGIILSIASIPAIVNAVHSVSNDPSTQISLKSQYRFGFSHFWSYIFVALLCLLITIGSTMLFIIPGIIIVIYTSLYLYAFAIGDKKGFSAFTESYSLIRRRWWPVVGRILFLMVIMIMIILIITGVNFLLNLLFGFQSNTGSVVASTSLGAAILSMVISLITNTIVGLISIGYTYKMYISLMATRDQRITTIAFKRWLVAFICVGVIGIILIFATIPLVVLNALKDARFKAQQATTDAQARMIQLQTETLNTSDSSTTPSQI